jgi:glycosyltransferase involved in cell wall biosynthesis
MSKKIVYIGNDLSTSSSNTTTLELLSEILVSKGYLMTRSSNKKNIYLRMLDMISTVFKNRKAAYVLIDTYSTKNFYYAFIISQLSRLLKIKYIPILHGGNLPERICKSKFLSDLIFKNSYANVSPSNYLKHEFEQKGYTVKNIPNAIKISDYKFLKREKLSPKILWVRSFNKIYNPELAIKVLFQLKRKYREATLCMIGPNSDSSFVSVKKVITDLNLSSSIEITGKLNKKDWRKKSEKFDIFINTSNVDNMPVSLVEAMALGLPIVSTNVGGIPYLIEDGKQGFLVEKNNVQAMTNSIIKMIESNSTSIPLNARKKSELFDVEEVSNKWIKLLK